MNGSTIMTSGTQSLTPEPGGFDRNLDALLPHRTPFLLLDQVRVEEEGKTIGRFQVPDVHPLVDSGRLMAGGLVEMMAQTAGAGDGLKRQGSSAHTNPGYIGAIKDLNIFALPETGQWLEARTELVHVVMNAHIVRGNVFEGERLLASCELKIFLQP